MDITFSPEAAWLALYGLVVGLFLGTRLQRFRSARREGGSAGSIEIYVGNLAYDLSEDDLRDMFEQFGPIENARIITNKFNGKSKGYGFVNMPGGPAADEAIRALNGKDIKGRQIVVNEAKGRARRDGRDGRNGRRG